MKTFAIYIIFFFAATAVFASAKTDSLFAVLKTELVKARMYDQQKQQRIFILNTQLSKTAAGNFNKRFLLCDNLYEEYKVYQFDSAYVYVRELLKISAALKDKVKENESRVKLSFILLSAGMFKETFDCLNKINQKFLDRNLQMQYYALKARSCEDLADYDSGNAYAKAEDACAIKYLDSAIALAAHNSYDQLKLMGERQLLLKQTAKPSLYYSQLLYQHSLTGHQRAMVSNALTYFYNGPQNTDKRLQLLAIAAICDIRSSVKETLAIFRLGKELYEEGNIPDAYTFIEAALGDAQFYGARLRTLKITSVMPMVAAKKLIITENKSRRFLTYFLLITALTIIVSLISFIVFNQLKRLKVKEKIIEEKNSELERINEWLYEDSRVKEQYIGNFFNVLSEYIMKLERLKRSAERKIATKKYDEILSTINEINIKKERETLFRMFDQIFLRIFPNFVTVFNSLLREEDQIWPKDHEVLNTDLRIFALMRLGINNNQAVANILEYSVNTIYVYKMRIKAKALVHGDEFDETIMSIKAVEHQPVYQTA